MRTMSRWAGRFIVLLSIGLCVAVSRLSVRSYDASDWAFVARGRMVLESFHGETVLEFYPPSPNSPWCGWQELTDFTPAPSGVMDFGVNVRGGPTADVPPNVRFPDWSVIILTAIAPVVYVSLLLRALARVRRGICRGCGYNLTGNTSGVCPECGLIVASRKGIERLSN